MRKEIVRRVLNLLVVSSLLLNSLSPAIALAAAQTGARTATRPGSVGASEPVAPPAGETTARYNILPAWWVAADADAQDTSGTPLEVEVVPTAHSALAADTGPKSQALPEEQEPFTVHPVSDPAASMLFASSGITKVFDFIDGPQGWTAVPKTFTWSDGSHPCTSNPVWVDDDNICNHHGYWDGDLCQVSSGPWAEFMDWIGIEYPFRVSFDEVVWNYRDSYSTHLLVYTSTNRVDWVEYNFWQDGIDDGCREEDTGPSVSKKFVQIAIRGDGIFGNRPTVFLNQLTFTNWLEYPYLLPPDQTYSPDECPFCGNAERQSYVGGPVNTYSGNYNYQTTDLSIPTRGQPLHFERAYNSLPVSGTVVYSRPLGYGWTHNYDMHLVFSDTLGGEADTVIVKAPHGSRMRFVDSGDGVYEPYPGVWATMVTGTNLYTVTAANQETLVFSATGQLAALVDTKGNRTAFSYSGGDLSRVTAPGGARWLDLTYDAQGRLVSVADHTGRSVGYGYDGDDNLTVFTDTLGQAWTYVYSGTHLLHEVTAPNSQVIERTFFDSQGRAVGQEDGTDKPVAEIEYLPDSVRVVTETGRVITETYNFYNVLAGQTDVLSNSTTYADDGYFNRVGRVDAKGNTTKYQRTPFGYTTAIEDALGHTTAMTYDDYNNLTARTDPLGRTTTYDYEVVTRTVNGQVVTLTNLITVTDPLSGTAVYDYNDDGQVTSVTDARDNTTTYGYDSLGQRVAVTDALGTATTYGYDGLGRLVTTTVAAGTELERVTLNEYDAADRLVRVTENYLSGQPQNHHNEYNLIIAYGYDAIGNRVAVTDTLGRATRYEYDAGGRLVKVTENYLSGQGQNYQNEYNLVTEYGYDALGRQEWVTDTLGYASRTEYDVLGRPVTVTVNFEDGAYSAATPDEDIRAIYGYDAVGNRVAVTDTLGRVTRTGHDALNRPVTVTVNYEDGAYSASAPDEDVRAVYGYDVVGNRVAVTDTLNHVTTFDYDALNRVIATTDALSGTTAYAYDAVGNRTVVTDALEHATTFAYDDLNRLTATTDALDGTTSYAYDRLGNRVAVTDVLGNDVAYAYDSLGRLKTTTDALDNVTAYTYDAAGNRIQVTDAESHTTDYGYDTLGRMTVITDAAGYATALAYDALGNRTATTDPLGHSTTFGYDKLGRTVAVTDALNNVTTYAYDGLGNRMAVTDAGDIATCYVYDDLNRLVEVKENCVSGASSTAITNVVTSYGYDGLGNRTVVTDARGYATTYVYDALNRLTSASDPLTHTTAYAYDALGNRTVITDAKGQVTGYTYDALNRLTEIDYPAPDADVTYAYDALGNRTAMTDATGTTTYAYDDVYRLTGVTDGQNQTVGYAYDAVGNRTAITYPGGSQVVTYTYDARNLLETVTDWDGGKTSYTYDDAGRLTGVSRPNPSPGSGQGGTSTSYTYDDGNRLTELTHHDDDLLLARYAYALDGVGNRVAVTETLRGPVEGVATLPVGLARADDALARARTRAPLDAASVAASAADAVRPAGLSAPMPVFQATETPTPTAADTPTATAADVPTPTPTSAMMTVEPPAPTFTPEPGEGPSPVISATLQPGVAQVLATAEGHLTLTVPVGAVLTPTLLVVTHAEPDLVTLPQGWAAVGPVYRFDTGLSFALPITITVAYTGEPDGHLTLHAWFDGAWHALATTVKPEARRATANAGRIEQLALLTVEPSTPVATPTAAEPPTPTATATDTPAPIETPTPEVTLTETPTPEPTPTATATETPTQTPTAVESPNEEPSSPEARPTTAANVTLLPHLEATAARSLSLALTVPPEGRAPALPKGWVAAGPVYRLQGGLKIAAPITVTLRYVGEPTTRIALHTWANGTWRPVEMTVEPGAQRLTVWLEQSRWLALFAAPPPDRPTATAADTPTPPSQADEEAALPILPRTTRSEPVAVGGPAPLGAGTGQNRVVFYDDLEGKATTWHITRVTALVPQGVTDGDVTVETSHGTSNGSPFAVGSSQTPGEAGEGTAWSSGFSGHISSDTTWDENIFVTGDVTVESGVTLTVEAGVTVFFAANSDDQAGGVWADKAEFRIYGALVAEGTAQDPIYFTSNAVQKTAGDWGGIVVRKGSTTSSLAWCVVHYAKVGVYFYTNNEGGGTLSGDVRNCTVTDNQYGIATYGRPNSGGTVTINPTLVHNLVRDNTNCGFWMRTTTSDGTSRNYALVQNNVIEGNGTGVYLRGDSSSEGHVDNYPEIVNNTIRDNTDYGVYVKSEGSSDSSGSDTDVQPVIENNLLESNDHNIYLDFYPRGADGTQILSPTIRYNTIRDATHGITVDDSEAYDTLNPTISHNVFYGFDGASSYAVNNLTTRTVVANDNYWGDTEAAWDAGPQSGDTNGSVTTSTYLDTADPPLLSRLDPGAAPAPPDAGQAGAGVTLHGANFDRIVIPRRVVFYDDLEAATSGWYITRIAAHVPGGAADGDVTVETSEGTSDGSPFVAGSSHTPSEAGEGTTWSSSFSGHISGDTTWDENVLLTGDVTVDSGATLTIEAGVTVFFVANSDDQSGGLWTGKAELLVYGTLAAEGTAQDPIYFTSNAAQKAAGDWGGIVIRKGSDVTLAGCVVHYADYGLYFYTYKEGGGSLSGDVRNCVIAHNNRGVSVYARPCYSSGGTVTTDPTIAGSLIRNNTDYGFCFYVGSGYGTSRNYTDIRNNVIEGNGTGVYLRGVSWWVGHADDYPQVVNNTIRDNTDYGVYVKSEGSSDGSGSDSDVQPTIENNLLQGNGHDLYLYLYPRGSDGAQILKPVIRYDTVRHAAQGITVDDSEAYDTLEPTISHNVFYGFDGASSYAVNNLTARTVVANDNYWGDTEDDWDAGPQAGDTYGAVTTDTHLDTADPPLLSRLDPAAAQAQEGVTLHGANFGAILKNPQLETGTVGGVGSSSYTTVTLSHHYTDMVVIATANYNNNSLPLVTRVRNAQDNSFQVKLQNPSGETLQGETVHYLVMEAGYYTLPDGRAIEGHRINSTMTDYKGSWQGQRLSYARHYTNPVVLGQVMSENDPDWSVFWDRGAAANSPPDGDDLWVGKMVGEDTDTDRADEVLGVVVIEAGSGELDGVAYRAALGADIVRGVGNSPPYEYDFAPSFSSTPEVALLTQAAMDGVDGAWAVLYGGEPLSASSIKLAVDEDQISNSERGHATEQVAYLVFEQALVYPRRLGDLVTTTVTYTYDPLYRLAGADYTGALTHTFAYAYDAAGNRAAMTKTLTSTVVTTYTYDAANRLVLSKVEGLTNVDDQEYTWDNNGNLTGDGTRTFTYDAGDRLTQVVSGTLTTQFIYSGDGHRMRKVVNGVTTTYAIGALGLPQVLVETTGGESTAYLHGHDLLAEKGSGGWSWHLPDGLGSVRQLTDDRGQVTLAQGYTPFGLLLWSEGNGSSGSGYGFTGEQEDPTVGLVFLRARYYDPATGRFISKDPFPGLAAMPGTLHPYLYSLNNPVNHTDPSGEILPAVALILAVAGGAFIIDWAAQMNYNMYTQGMSFWDAAYHKNIDEAEMLTAGCIAGLLTGLTIEAVGLVLAGGGAALMQTGMWADSSRTFGLGQSFQNLATRWNTYMWSVPRGNGWADETPLELESPAMKRARESGVPTGGYSNKFSGESWPPRQRIGEPIQDLMARGDFVETQGIYEVTLNDPDMADLARALEGVPRAPGEFGERVLVSRYIYAIDVNGEIIVSRWTGIEHHSDLVQGANVLGAGEMYIDTEGDILFIDDASGHYWPKGSEFGTLLKEKLRELGISIQRTAFRFR